ncbi:hypothetical protein [Streptomyces yaizuensis]|uniref:Cytochrome c maturation protein CcmE n=1 Tax=Streptomyces yaizuensis TaxID=2989713 RepID=A0ABQ5NQX6_9ACTN|nr:hypothetical protein [Streptomyces sp. YSPA8]GLF92788.1 cytochrome c maturation protein CcmE [Streptomyces sp. YSPA8]
MHPESTNGTSGGAPAIPMAWLCAEYVADELLRTGALVEGGSLEYRAGRETLALTIYLCDATEGLAGVRTMSRIEEWLDLTAYGHPWSAWVVERLAAREERERGPGGAPDPDLALARESWRWLWRTELLAADLGEDEPWYPVAGAGTPVDEGERKWTPAWRLGLPLSHLAIHLF